MRPAGDQQLPTTVARSARRSALCAAEGGAASGRSRRLGKAGRGGEVPPPKFVQRALRKDMQLGAQQANARLSTGQLWGWLAGSAQTWRWGVMEAERDLGASGAGVPGA